VTVEQEAGSGRLRCGGGSDSELSAGVVAVLGQALSGLTPDEVGAACCVRALSWALVVAVRWRQRWRGMEAPAPPEWHG